VYQTYEEFIAESGLLTQQTKILCLQCGTATPEDGCDHCTACLDKLNGAVAA